MPIEIIVALIGAGAVLGAVILQYFLGKRQIKKELESTTPLATLVTPEPFSSPMQDASPTRYLDQPHQVRFIESLPEQKAAVYRNSQKSWDTGITADMVQASYDFVGFLTNTWDKLVEFYPENHFGKLSNRDYIHNYVSDRFTYHRAKYEPEGPGTNGTIVGVLAGGDVIGDLEAVIIDMVATLSNQSEYIDFKKWLQEWKKASEDRE